MVGIDIEAVIDRLPFILLQIRLADVSLMFYFSS